MECKYQHPLQWPLGYMRTPAQDREFGAFKQNWTEAKKELLRQLSLLGADNVVISSNRPLDTWNSASRISEADRKAQRDPGVAVYFSRKKKDLVLACDSFNEVWKNLYAIALIIDGIRRSERYRIPGFIDNVFSGFQKLLPGTYKNPWEILGVREHATNDEIDDAFYQKANEYHPDKGGSDEQMRDLNWAREEAKSLNQKR